MTLSKNVESMILGLVRAAELKEQDEGGQLWDDESRKALEAARSLGWGANRVGSLARSPEWCANCPFAKHVHYEEGDRLVAPGCTGFSPKVD